MRTMTTLRYSWNAVPPEQTPAQIQVLPGSRSPDVSHNLWMSRSTPWTIADRFGWCSVAILHRHRHLPWIWKDPRRHETASSPELQSLLSCTAGRYRNCPYIPSRDSPKMKNLPYLWQCRGPVRSWGLSRTSCCAWYMWWIRSQWRKPARDCIWKGRNTYWRNSHRSLRPAWSSHW